MRLKRRYVAVLAAFTLFIAGCSYNLVGRMSGDGKAEGTVTFSVTDIPPNYAKMIEEAQNPASRSILPNAPFAPGDTSLTFILTGTSNSGKALPEAGQPGAITVTPTLSGSDYTFTQSLGAYVWDLTLTAYKGSPANKMKVLVGHCTVDLTMGNGNADFKMSIKGLTTPGTVKVSGTVKDPDQICTQYEIGIYNLYTGEFIEKYTAIDGTLQNTNAKLPVSLLTPATSFSFNYGTSPVVTLNPGAYEYRMIFYKGPSSDLKPIGSYSDTIVVYPGNDLVQAIGELDILNKRPTKPENLRAYLKDKSEDKEPNSYYVKLTWDPARFETNYELMLKTSSDDGTTLPVNGTIYGFKSTNTNAEDFLASPIRHDGSLAYGSTTCTLKLQLGKVYEVSIRAHNYIGESEWVERLVEGPTTAAAEPNHTYFEALPTPSPGKHINRRRIKYDLNGGTLTHHTTPPTTFTGAYIEYDSYTGTAKPLLSITASTPTPAAGSYTLTRQIVLPPGTLEWAKWLNPNNGQEVTVAVPTGPVSGVYRHENVFVKADFGSSLGGTVTPLPGPQDLPKANIKLTYNEDTSSLSPPLPTPSLITEAPPASNHYPVPKKVNNKPTWITVEFQGLSSPPDYDDLHCTAYFASGAGLLSKVDIQAVGNICTFSTGEYTPQIFTLKVMARDTATNQMRSQTYIIDLY